MNKSLAQRYLPLWMPVLLWMLVIFSFSNRPTIQASAFDPLDFIFKKTAHLGEYAILFILTFRALHQSLIHKISIDVNENICIFIVLLYAMSDEWHQSFISGRTATVRDILIDFIGILIGLSIIKYIKNNSKKFRKVGHFIYGSK